jgi:hypothetical protein
MNPTETDREARIFAVNILQHLPIEVHDLTKTADTLAKAIVRFSHKRELARAIAELEDVMRYDGNVTRSQWYIKDRLQTLKAEAAAETNKKENQ